MANEQRDRWLARRREGVGASEVPGILALSPWASPLSVWADKVMTLDERIDEALEAIRWGNILEVPILHEGARIHHLDVEAVPQNQASSIVRHPRWPEVRLQCTPDAWLIGDEETGAACGLVEVKTTSAYQGDAWADGVPLHYQAQVQAQLACTGLPRAVVLCLVGGQRLVRHDVERDEAAIALIEAAVVEFWGYVERREQPPARPSAVDVRALERLHPEDSGLEVEADERLAALVALRDELAEQAAALGAQRDAVTVEIKTLLGAATWARLPDGRRLAYRWQERPEHLTKASRSRVLRVVKAKP